MARNVAPLCTVFSIIILLIVACLVAVRKRDKPTPRDTEGEPGEAISQQTSSKTIEANDTRDEDQTVAKRYKHDRRRFCRKCCQTPPCWYKNSDACGRCNIHTRLKLIVRKYLERDNNAAYRPKRAGTLESQGT